MKKLKPEKKKCDNLFAKIITSIGQCEKCGSKSYLQTAHIYSRRYLHTRYDLENAVCLCAKCHMWAHWQPIEFTKWLQTRLGDDLLDSLRKRANTFGKIDYEQTYNTLKELYEHL